MSSNEFFDPDKTKIRWQRHKLEERFRANAAGPRPVDHTAPETKPDAEIVHLRPEPKKD